MYWRHVHWLVMLIAFVGYGESIACPKDFCARVLCQPASPKYCESQKPPQEYRERATFCGCCGICKPYAEEGEQCNTAIRLGVGDPPQVPSHCRPGLHCNSRHVCQRPTCYFI